MGAIVLYWAVTTLVGTVWSGPLDPPAAPAPTQRTQITSLPFTASVSGSYVVMADLTCTACNAGASGITVDADDVTIDLNGFAIKGVAGSGVGIKVMGSRSGVSVQNGVVSDWIGFSIDFTTCSRCRVEDLEVFDGGSHGIFMGDSSTVSNVISADNNGVGILLGLNGNVIRDSVVYGNDLGIAFLNDGNVIRDSVVHDNSQFGISIQGDGNVVENNVVRNSQFAGIGVFGSNNTIKGNDSISNGGEGIRAFTGDHLIIQNRAVANTSADYVIVAGNTVGPIVVGPVDPIASTNPWANFSY